MTMIIVMMMIEYGYNNDDDVVHCIVSMHLYSASCSAHQSEALPVRETQREGGSLERTKKGSWLAS